MHITICFNIFFYFFILIHLGTPYVFHGVYKVHYDNTTSDFAIFDENSMQCIRFSLKVLLFIFEKKSFSYQRESDVVSRISVENPSDSS